MTLKLHAVTLTVTTILMVSARPAAAQNSICSIYPTRCHPYSGPQPVGPLGLPGYPGTSPIYTPGVMAPAMGMVVRDALNALPPAVRHSLYPQEAANAVRSGAVDAVVEKTLRTGFDPYARIINGTGPGGAAYTNKAAIDVMNGTSPIWKLGAALSPYAIPLDRSANTARSLQLDPRQQRQIEEMQRVLLNRERTTSRGRRPAQQNARRPRAFAPDGSRGDPFGVVRRGAGSDLSTLIRRDREINQSIRSH
jgi:hypothetical protein